LARIPVVVAMAIEIDTRTGTLATVTAYLVSLCIKMEIEGAATMVTAALKKHARGGKGENQYYTHSYSSSDTSSPLSSYLSQDSVINAQYTMALS
jgi:hypothetical protein